MREYIALETYDSYVDKLKKNIKKEMEKEFLSQMSDKNKFYHFVRNQYKKYSLINNKLFKNDEKTEEAKKVIEYIYSRFNKEKFKVEKNSNIFYDEGTSLIFDLAAKEQSNYNGIAKDREIFCSPHFMCDITLSERTRAQYIKNTKLNDDGFCTYWIIDLKAKLLMSFENKVLGYKGDFCRIITKETGKFNAMGIEFNAKELFI